MNTRISIFQIRTIASTVGLLLAFLSISTVVAGERPSFGVTSVELINRQGIAQNPSFIEIATPIGQREVISFDAFQQKPYWQEIEPSISSTVAVFNENRAIWEERDDLVIDEYQIIIPGTTNDSGQIEPLLTPMSNDGTVAIQHLYFSTDNRGYFFVHAEGSWNIYVSEASDLLDASPNQPPEDVVVAEGSLVALAGIDTDTPFPVAYGTPNSDTQAIDWEGVDGQGAELADSTVAEQIPAAELAIMGDYTTGVRFNYQGINWEFVGDFDSIQFDATRMDVPRFINLLNTLIQHSFQPRRYESAVVDTIRISFNYDATFAETNLGALYISDRMYGLNNPRLEGRTLSQRIVYNNEFIAFFESFTDIEEREMIFGFLTAMQMTIGDRIGPITNWRILSNNYMYKLVGLPTDRMPTMQEFLSKLSGFGLSTNQ